METRRYVVLAVIFILLIVATVFAVNIGNNKDSKDIRGFVDDYFNSSINGDLTYHYFDLSIEDPLSVSDYNHASTKSIEGSRSILTFNIDDYEFYNERVNPGKYETYEDYKEYYKRAFETYEVIKDGDNTFEVWKEGDYNSRWQSVYNVEEKDGSKKRVSMVVEKDMLDEVRIISIDIK